MADIPNRTELEAKLAKLLATLNAAQLGKLLELLGDPPLISNVPADFWRRAGEEFAAVVLPFVERIYLTAAKELMELAPVGVDFTLINQEAADWAASYTFELVTEITDTSRINLQKLTARYFEEQMTIGEFRDALTPTFGPVRADMIAQTEVTRASVQGELATVRELGKFGVVLTATWSTNMDEHVCVICQPLDGQGPEVWNPVAPNGPPAHVRCRCWLNHVLIT